MPLTDKGKEILRSLKQEYGEKKGEQVFYAGINSGRYTDTHVKKPKKRYRFV